MVRKRRGRFTDQMDLAAFIGTFVSGIAAYLLMKHHGLPQWSIMATIVALMVAYAFLVVNVKRVQVRLDQAGDNAYYLGLLFTLSSMAIALYGFRIEETTDEAGLGSKAAAILISNFGIALASTIAGIAIRVVLHQMRMDPAEIEHVTRVQLSEAANRVMATIDQLSLSLAQFYTKVEQRAGDVTDTLSKEANATVEQLRTSLESTSSEMTKSIRDVQQKILLQSEELTGLIGNTADEALAAIGRLRSVEGPPTELIDKLNAMSAAFADSSSRASSTVGSLEAAALKLDSVNGSFGQLTGTIRSSLESMVSEYESSLKEISSSVDSVKNSVSASAEQADGQKEAFQTIEFAATEAAKKMETVTAASTAVLERLTELVGKLVEVVKVPEELVTAQDDEE